jgi:threonine synthase
VRTQFAVPTGNFGNVLAGYYARRMGLPIERLIVGCNENDILHRMLLTGCYHREGVVPTISPSMDIEISSNLERYFYYLADEDAARVRHWMEQFKSTGKLTLDTEQLIKAQLEFASGRASQDEVCGLQLARALSLSICLIVMVMYLCTDQSNDSQVLRTIGLLARSAHGGWCLLGQQVPRAEP